MPKPVRCGSAPFHQNSVMTHWYLAIFVSLVILVLPNIKDLVEKMA